MQDELGCPAYNASNEDRALGRHGAENPSNAKFVLIDCIPQRLLLAAGCIDAPRLDPTLKICY